MDGTVLLLRPPGVYRADRDTDLLIRTLTRTGAARGRHVLDVCSGTGAVALAAGRDGAASVTAVDLSVRSALATRTNALLHRVPMTVRRGDMFAPVAGQRFDVVLANPPYVPAASDRPARHRMDRCWDAGTDGRLLLDRICAGLPDVLTPGGTVLLVHSAVCGTEETIARLDDVGVSAGVAARAVVPYGPVMRARARLLESRGLVTAGQRDEEIVVVRGTRS